MESGQEGRKEPSGQTGEEPAQKLSVLAELKEGHGREEMVGQVRDEQKEGLSWQNGPHALSTYRVSGGVQNFIQPIFQL